MLENITLPCYNGRMDQEVASLMLEHLKYLRKGQDEIKNDLRDLKFRVGKLVETSAHHSNRFDRITFDLDIIKKRLDLVEA